MGSYLSKNAGNDRHFSSNVAHLSSNSADTMDDGNNLLLKNPPFCWGPDAEEKLNK
jgi:hypothetical protein